MLLHEGLCVSARGASDPKWGCLHSDQKAMHSVGGTCLIYMTLACSKRAKSNIWIQIVQDDRHKIGKGYTYLWYRTISVGR